MYVICMYVCAVFLRWRRWLGLRSKHVDEFAEKCNAQADGRDEFSAALQKMTAHDHRETSRLVARFQSINLVRPNLT